MPPVPKTSRLAAFYLVPHKDFCHTRRLRLRSSVVYFCRALPTTVRQKFAVESDFDAVALGVLDLFDMAAEINRAHDAVTKLR